MARYELLVMVDAELQHSLDERSHRIRAAALPRRDDAQGACEEALAFPNSGLQLAAAAIGVAKEHAALRQRAPPLTKVRRQGAAIVQVLERDVPCLRDVERAVRERVAAHRIRAQDRDRLRGPAQRLGIELEPHRISTPPHLRPAASTSRVNAAPPAKSASRLW